MVGVFGIGDVVGDEGGGDAYEGDEGGGYADVDAEAEADGANEGEHASSTTEVRSNQH